MTTEILTAAKTNHSGQLGRLVDLFYAPERLFRNVLKDRSWWLPFLLTVVCSYVLTFSSAYKVGFHQMTVNAMLADPGNAARFNEDMSPEQRDAAIGAAETSFQISAFSAPALILLYNVVYGFALWAVLNLAGGRADFSSIFTVLLYADLIQNVRAILSTIILFLKQDPSTFNLQNSVGSNLGYYLDSSYTGWLRTLLDAADLITIWYLVVIALGCAVVANLKRSSSAGIVFGLWLLIVVSRVMWAAII